MAGTWTITGEYMKVSDTATVVVLHGTANELTIEPAYGTITSGATLSYTATAQDTAGNTWSVTAETTFDCGDTLGTWTGNVYTANMAGTWVITGEYHGVSGTAVVVVLHGTATALIIEPALGAITSGAILSYTATAQDTAGNTWDVTAKTAFSCNDTQKTWTSNVYTAGMAGTWTITGEYSGVSDTATIIVLPELPANIAIGTITDQIYRQPFSLTIRTLNRQGSLLPYFGTLTLSDLTGNITTHVVEIKNGKWTGTISINKSMLNDRITCEIAGKRYSDNSSNSFNVLIANASNETISDVGVVIEIPANSVDDDYCLEINHEPSGWEINNANHQAGTASVLSDTLCKITITNAFNEELIFQPSIPLSLIYQPEQLGNIDSTTLQICRLQNGQWIPVPGGKVYPNNRMVTAFIDNPGTFILRGVAFGNKPSDVIVYPNPCKGTEIIFRHTDNCTIEIYDMAGDLLKKVHVQGAEYRWDTRDDYGKLLDSGAYIYVIIMEKENRCGKVVIIR